VNGLVPKIAVEYGLNTYAGAWIDTNGVRNNQEIEALTEIANNYDIDGVIIGNEYLLRRAVEVRFGTQHDSIMKKSAANLISMIKKAKAGIHKNQLKFAVAETFDQIYDSDKDSIRDYFQPVLDQLDIVLVHIYPFWSFKPISGAADTTINIYRKVKKVCERQNKKVIIGETGWPSTGIRKNGNYGFSSEASLTNQRLYLIDFLSRAESCNADYMYFDAFDELWKTEEGTVGQNWGYCYSDRSNKHCFNGVLLPEAENKTDHGRHITGLPNPATDQADRRFTIYDEWPPISLSDPVTDKRTSYGDYTAVSDSTKIDSVNNNIFIPGGFMGNYNAIKLNQCDRSDSYSGLMAARIDINFDDCPSWAGVQWLANNAWDGPGIDVYKVLKIPDSSAVFLKFWAKGLRGDEKIKFGIGGDKGSLDKREKDWLTLNTEWTPYVFSFRTKNELSNVIGGLFVITDLIHNRGRPTTIFLDYIYFEAAQ
jgi:exo-beta-1,3-glucanase (GH17 family)